MKLGIYGGTFSPPHKGHIAAAKAFVDSIKPDKLLIIPTNVPPHKEQTDAIDSDDRLKMCRIAFADIDCAEISDMEIRRGGRSYTYMTLEELTDAQTEIFFLCGTDMILTLDLWRNFKRIFELATICYVRRESDRENDSKIDTKVSEYTEKYGARIIKIDHTVLELSSTEIREAVLGGRDALDMLTSDVLSYIRERGLYQ